MSEIILVLQLPDYSCSRNVFNCFQISRDSFDADANVQRTQLSDVPLHRHLHPATHASLAVTGRQTGTVALNTLSLFSD